MTSNELVELALRITDPAARGACLDAACAGNPALRREAEALLAERTSARPRTLPEVSDGTGRPEGTPTPAVSATVAVGTLIAGKYKLLEAIGEGGMGSVWMARQTEPVNRLVAVKLIKPGMDSKQVLARFEAERQALAMMDHPNIARVLDVGATNAGRPFFVMELVKGTPITTFCDDRTCTRLPPFFLTDRMRLENVRFRGGASRSHELRTKKHDVRYVRFRSLPVLPNVEGLVASSRSATR